MGEVNFKSIIPIPNILFSSGSSRPGILLPSNFAARLKCVNLNVGAQIRKVQRVKINEHLHTYTLLLMATSQTEIRNANCLNTKKQKKRVSFCSICWEVKFTID